MDSPEETPEKQWERLLGVRTAMLRMQANRDFARRGLPLLGEAWKTQEITPVTGREGWLELLRPSSYRSGKSSASKDKGHPLVRRLRMRFIPWVFGSKDEMFEELVGIDAPKFREWIAAKFTEGMTWETHGYWHLDHIRPVKLFNHDDPSEVKVCWGYRNFQPLWGRDNLKKGKKLNYGQDPIGTNPPMERGSPGGVEGIHENLHEEKARLEETLLGILKDL